MSQNLILDVVSPGDTFKQRAIESDCQVKLHKKVLLDAMSSAPNNGKMHNILK